MRNTSRGADGGRDSRTQVSSREKLQDDYPEAADILAVWIAEGVVAFAKSFDAKPAEVLKEAVERIHAESLLEQDARHSEKGDRD